MLLPYGMIIHLVRVIIPRGEKFEQTAKNNFPPVTQNNTQTISLNDMLAPGYPLNASKPNVAVIN